MSFFIGRGLFSGVFDLFLVSRVRKMLSKRARDRDGDREREIEIEYER